MNGKISDINSNPEYGPIKKRVCRDVFWLILFALFWVIMAYLGYFGYGNGNLSNLLLATDYYHNYCGSDNVNNSRAGIWATNLTDKPYAYYYDPTDPLLSFVQCVATCPNGDYSDLSKYVCKYDVVLNDTDPVSLAADVLSNIFIGDCAPFLIPSTPVLNRCVPSIVAGLVNATQAAFANITINGTNNSAVAQSGNMSALLASAGNFSSVNASAGLFDYLATQNVLQQCVIDLVNSWRWVLILGIGGAIIGTLIWLIMLQCCTVIFVWMVLLSIEGVLGFGTYYFGSQWFAIKNSLDYVPGSKQLSLPIYISSVYLGVFIAVGVIFLIMTLLILVSCKRIRIATAIIKEATKAVGKMPLIVFFPLWPFIASLVCTGYCLIVIGYLWSSNAVSITFAGLFTITNQNVMDYLALYVLFGFFWTIAFIDGCGMTTIAGAIAQYYWTMDKRKVPGAPVLASLARVICYHMGSIALGSFLIAVLQIIRYMIQQIKNRLKGKNKVVKCLLTCLACCFWCLEKVLKFLTRNAYIEIAIHGQSFCKAAQDAFKLLLANALRLVFVTGISEFLLFLGKLGITCAVGYVSYTIFSNTSLFFTEVNTLTSNATSLYNAGLNASSSLTSNSSSTYSIFSINSNGTSIIPTELLLPSIVYYPVPIAVSCLVAYVLTAMFLYVYQLAIDTTFLCFCEDVDKNDGSPTRPYYMSKELMNIMEVHNQGMFGAAANPQNAMQQYYPPSQQQQQQHPAMQPLRTNTIAPVVNMSQTQLNSGAGNNYASENIKSY